MSKFLDFSALHVAGEPLVLFNAWDPGSATAVAKSGAKAIATGSWSVAAAYGSVPGAGTHEVSAEAAHSLPSWTSPMSLPPIVPKVTSVVSALSALSWAALT